MSKAKVLPGVVKGYIIVRGPDGKVIWDDPFSVPQAFYDSLSDRDKEDLENGRNAYDISTKRAN